MICEIYLPGYLVHLPEKKLQAFIIFGVFFLQYLAEHIFPQQKKYNDVKHEGFNLLIGILNGLLLYIPSALLIELLSCIDTFNIGLLQQFALPLWANIVITILVMDFLMYWWHRFNHTKIFFWQFHKFHHREEKMNSITALRFHGVELIFSVIGKAAFYLLLGFFFIPILVYEALFFIVVVLHHSNIRVSKNFDMVYRQIFSSPQMHRIHHSNIQQETDSNYGSVFSWWDRLFGTYKKTAAGEIVFGIDKNAE